MIPANQARKDLESNEKADREREARTAAKRREEAEKELKRALKEDVPKYMAAIEKSIYEAVAARNNNISFHETASIPVSECFDVVKTKLEGLGYKVRKDYYSGERAMSDDCSYEYQEYILYVTW
jgi:hypothetical protein